MAVPPAIQPRRMRRRMLSKATVEGLDNRIEPEHSQCSEPMVNRFLQRPESLALCGKGADRGADAPNLNRPRFSTRSLGNARSPTIGTTNRVSGFNSLSVAMLPAAADVPLVLSLSKDEPSARGSTSSPRAEGASIQVLSGIRAVAGASPEGQPAAASRNFTARGRSFQRFVDG